MAMVKVTVGTSSTPPPPPLDLRLPWEHGNQQVIYPPWNWYTYILKGASNVGTVNLYQTLLTIIMVQWKLSCLP